MAAAGGGWDIAYGAGVSRRGRYIAFVAHSAGRLDVYLRDRARGVTRLISKAPSGAAANGPSDHAQLSLSGRFILFRSKASNLVTGDRNRRGDLFIDDRRSHDLRRVRVAPQGRPDRAVQTPVVADSGLIAFSSRADNIVRGDTNGVEDVFVVLPLRPGRHR